MATNAELVSRSNSMETDTDIGPDSIIFIWERVPTLRATSNFTQWQVALRGALKTLDPEL